MPKVKLNGSKPPSNVDPHYELTKQILNELREFWMDQNKSNRADEITFSRLSVVAYTQFSAMVAVDSGMGEDQFVNICRLQFEEAFRRAPKWS